MNDTENKVERANRRVKYAATKDSNGPRGRACNECKQQKLRCDLANATHEARIEICSRCQKLGLRCRVEDNFKRTRKRRTSYELEREVRELKKRLAKYESEIEPSISGTDVEGRQSSTLPDDANITGSKYRTNSISAGDLINDTAGLTTVPTIELPDDGPLLATSKPKARSIGDIQLSIREINELFIIYFEHYHHHIPFLNRAASASAFFESCELLFWAIISVAARRYEARATLLPQLSKHVSDMTWHSIRKMPTSKGVVQSLVLLCAWPFPISSTALDSTYLLAGIMLQLGTQLGLHRVLSPEDYTKYSLTLSTDERSDRIETWTACCMVASCVSIGNGFKCPVDLQDWSIIAAMNSPDLARVDNTLKFAIRVEQFRDSVVKALASHIVSPDGLLPTNQRLPLYKILERDYLELEGQATAMPALHKLHSLLAAVHLRSFYLFDEPESTTFEQHMITLYNTALSAVEHAIQMDYENHFFSRTVPFFHYQTLVSAIFIIVKILSNGHFGQILEPGTGRTTLNSAIGILKKVSVARNDIPGRLSDVLVYFITLPDPSVFGGRSMSDLTLGVRSRYSLSIIYDSLWIWRRDFHRQLAPQEITDQQPYDSISQFMDIQDFDQLFGYDASADLFAWPGLQSG